MSEVQRNHNILILVKTYPSPSRKYVETCCTAGIDESGQMVRIYPIPFRLLAEGKQYRKWQWISGDTWRTTQDRRPESRKINYPDMVTTPAQVTEWPEKVRWLQKCPQFASLAAIETERQKTGGTLGVIKVDSISGLEIQQEAKDWTAEQKSKLSQDFTQSDLFSSEDAEREIATLEKIPYGFYYQFRSGGSDKIQRIRITDWEICQLYRNVKNKPSWQDLIQEKYVGEFSTKDVYLILGTVHRFPNEWLCIGVVAAPKGTQAPATLDLF